MRTYTQLTQAQRYQMYALKKMGHNQTEVANCIGMDVSTISRELKRNYGERSYRLKQALRLALIRRRKGQSRIQADTWAVIAEKFRLDWNLEQIAG